MLSETEEAICQQLGLNPHEYIEVREAERVNALNQERGDDGTEAKIARMMGIDPKEISERKAQITKQGAADAPLSDEELKICRSMGVEPLEYYQIKRKEAGLKPI